MADIDMPGSRGRHCRLRALQAAYRRATSRTALTTREDDIEGDAGVRRDVSGFALLS